MSLKDRVNQRLNIAKTNNTSNPLEDTGNGTIEKKVAEPSGIPDIKQWIPYYGAVKALLDEARHRPSIISEKNCLCYMGGLIVHAASLGAGIMGISYAIYELTH